MIEIYDISNTTNQFNYVIYDTTTKKCKGMDSLYNITNIEDLNYTWFKPTKDSKLLLKIENKNIIHVERDYPELFI